MFFWIIDEKKKTPQAHADKNRRKTYLFENHTKPEKKFLINSSVATQDWFQKRLRKKISAHTNIKEKRKRDQDKGKDLEIETRKSDRIKPESVIGMFQNG